MPLIQCPKCKKNIDDASQYCSYCGHKIVPDIVEIEAKKNRKRNLPICPNCEKEVAFTSEKCPYCGHKLVPQKPPEESRFIECPNCGRDIVRTSEKCTYCGFRLNPTAFREEDDDDNGDGKSMFKEFQKGCSGCNKGLFQLGCGMTLLMVLLGLLLFLLGII